MKCNVLFLNGWAAKPDVFAPLIEEIKAYIDKVLIIDWYDSKHTSVDRIDSMVKLLANSSPKRPLLLFGWSSGTMPILSYLGSDRIDSSVKGAFLFGSTARFIASSTPDYNFGWHKQIIEQMISNFTDNSNAVIEAFCDKAYSTQDAQEDHHIDSFKNCFDLEFSSESAKQELKSGLEYLAHSDVRMRVQKILHPLVLIAGDKDRICPLKGSEWIHEHSHNSKLYVIEGSGHAPQFFKPKQCSSIIVDFIKEMDLK